MSEKDEFLQRIIAAFEIEAEEILETMTTSLLALEKADSEAERLELLELIYRQAHTLKGASRAVDILEVETVCQELETVFSILKSGERHLNAEGVDLLLRSIDLIRKILAVRIGGDSSVSYNVISIVSSLKSLLIKLSNGSNSASEDAAVPVIDEEMYEHEPVTAGMTSLPKIVSQQTFADDNWKQEDRETIRVSISKLDKLLMQLEEMLAVKLSTIQMKKQLQVMLKHFARWRTGASEIIPSVNLLREIKGQKSENCCSQMEYKALQKTLRFLHWGDTLAKKTEADLARMLKFWEDESEAINLQVDTLLWDTKKIMMVPFSEVLELFPKIVRDLSRENGKSVKLIIRGEAIEIDRRILERLKNPLIHLLRNSIDHGIEKPAERKRKQKDEMGVISINLERSHKKRIRFTIEDDGAGINLKKLKMAVQAQGTIQNQDLEAEDKLIQYIYRSGISTSDTVNEISGRGLGLAIMKRSIDDLEGTIEVKTEKDKGTRFVIELPVSLVTFRGIIVHAGDGEYVIPTTRIDRVLLIKKEDIKTIENKSIIYYERELVPLACLESILEKGFSPPKSDRLLVMLINDEGRQIAIRIDGIEEEQEILVKSFNPHLKSIRNIAGATILGSGKIVPILNPQDMVNTVFKKK
ncbi:MAG: chemotaxis protein CheW [Candidatus Cloacimonetes bacterium]|nr:chemotaxis protein CheW [Candidatus Cloacimonadota bacterium]